MTTSTSCPICLDDFDTKKCVKISCQYCPFSACRGCQQRFLLQSYEDPSCMECKRGWTVEFMATNFPLTFRNDTLRKHRRKILLEREKSMLPATQVYVGWKKEMDEVQKLLTPIDIKLNGVKNPPEGSVPPIAGGIKMEENSLSVRYARTRRDLTAVNEDIMDMPRNYDRIGELRKRREQLENQFIAADKAYKEKRAEVNELTKAYNTLYTQHWHLERRYNGLDPTAAPQQRREFIMRCPADGCRGFLSSAYKCGLCSKWTCTKCLECIGEAKEGEHTCKPESVESAKLIQKETRPCPKCGTRIYKIDGCDQMWCVMEGCNTAFSWNTGHVVTGTIHNPHYYEWLRRTGGNLPRETGDIPCGGIPGFHFLNRIGRCLFLNEGLRNKLYAVHRGLNDFNEVRLPQFPARPPAMMNKDENVRYLMNEVNEEEWQRLLVNKESRFIRKREIGQILQTIITAGSDLLNGIDARITAVSAVYDRAITQMQQQVQTRVLTPALRNDALRQGRIDVSARIRTEQKEAIEWLEGAALTQLEELRAYANDSYKLLGKRMHMAVPQIAEDWTWKPVRILYRDPSKKKKAPAAAAGTAQNMIEGDGDSDTEEADALI